MAVLRGILKRIQALWRHPRVGGNPLLFKNATVWQWPSAYAGVTWLSIVCVNLCLSIPPAFALPTYNDAEVKAAFLFQLPHFITWPEDDRRFPVFCALGDNPFEKVPEARQIKPVGLHQVEACQVLFISESESANTKDILAYTQKYPLLTVSDIKTFAKSGGMVGFTEVNGKIKLELNTRALADAGFRMDQHLLEVAHHVY